MSLFRTPRYSIAPLLLVAVLCTVSAACRKEEERPPAPRTSHLTVLVGLVPEESIFANANRYRLLFRYLSQRTGYDVRSAVFPHYDDVVQSLTDGKIDAAVLGSFSYVLARERTGAQVLVRPEWADGRSAYEGCLIVRKDSGIRSVKEMRGRRFVFVDRDTTAGFVLPLAYFRAHGVDYHSWFREVYYAGTHADAVKDVLNREADAGAVKSTVLDRMAAENGRIGSEITVLERWAEMPENGFTVRSDMAPAVRERLASALLTMQNDRDGMRVLEAFGARRFVRSVDDDYRPVRDAIRAAGIDLRTGREAAGR